MKNEALRERLIKTREAAGFASSEAAARHLDIAARTYAKQEIGQHRATLDELRRYAEAFSVSPSWLLTGIGRGPTAAQ